MALIDKGQKLLKRNTMSKAARDTFIEIIIAFISLVYLSGCGTLEAAVNLSSQYWMAIIDDTQKIFPSAGFNMADRLLPPVIELRRTFNVLSLCMASQSCADALTSGALEAAAKSSLAYWMTIIDDAQKIFPPSGLIMANRLLPPVIELKRTYNVLSLCAASQTCADALTSGSSL